MKTVTLMLTVALTVSAAPADAQRMEWPARASVTPAPSGGARPARSPSSDRISANTGSTEGSSSLVDLLSTVLDHVRLTGEGERLALDLRLSRQAVDIQTPMPTLDGSDWRLLLRMSIGLARLSSRDPLDHQFSRTASANTLFLESGLRVEYRPAASWLVFVSFSDHARLDATRLFPPSDPRRAQLRPLEVATWARPVVLGIEVRQP